MANDKEIYTLEDEMRDFLSHELLMGGVSSYVSRRVMEILEAHRHTKMVRRKTPFKRTDFDGLGHLHKDRWDERFEAGVKTTLAGKDEDLMRYITISSDFTEGDIYLTYEAKLIMYW